jgi:NADH-quinone oxidoreductase subunit G
MCDEGRLGFHYVNSAERIRHPLVRRDANQMAATWSEVAPLIRSELKEAVQRDGAGVIGVLSPFLTCEEAYLFAKFLKGLSGEVRLALGPIPVVGEDDAYPKDRQGRPIQPVKFTIHAEKCPNRRGVEEVLRHFQGEVVGFDSVVRQAGAGKLQAVYVAACYPPRPGGWISEEQAASLAKSPLFIVQDILPSPASQHAGFVVPGSAWAEKDGTFVNHGGLAQAVHWAVTPTGECRSDGQIFLDLMERRGLIHVPSLRQELARDAPYFAPLAETELGEHGILLQSAK